MNALPPFFVIGNADSRRVALFQEALCGLGQSPACLVNWYDLLTGQALLTDVVAAGAVVRIESPGKDFSVERELIALGIETKPELAPQGVTPEAVRALPFDKGCILWPRLWFTGFCEMLARMKRQLVACPEHRLMNAPEEIAIMFDKRATHRLLVENGVPVPRSLNPVQDWNGLQSQMDRHRCQRVFLKLTCGSSASGVAAYRRSDRHQQALTTVEMVRAEGEETVPRLYNSRLLQKVEGPDEICILLSTLIEQGVHVEEWLPKAGVAGRAFDLRVMVIGGRVRQVVARLSRGPMTNLHLLNEQGDIEAVRQHVGAEAWKAAMHSCEAVMKLFPNSLYAGIDLMFTPDFRRHAVLEVNAFGDLLPGVLHNGQDTYSAEILEYAK